ncbi:MAG: hypothetical protein ACRDK3_15685 [Actinomycetota bacterium]
MPSDRARRHHLRGPAAWDAWLSANHRRQEGVWLKILTKLHVADRSGAIVKARDAGLGRTP